MLKPDAKTIYAQSSDIKSRTYLEYRKDMKRKAIAELEALEWVEGKIKDMHPNEEVRVLKWGGDRFLWFLRKGGISREPDFIAKVGEEEIALEFQYAEKGNLNFYDFKVSKVSQKKGAEREPIPQKLFIYIHKPSFRYAILTPQWIMENATIGMVAAWRSEAYRVPKETFEKVLLPDESLKPLCRMIDVKNFLLDFQHQQIEEYKERLSHLLQGVIDEDKIVKIIPKDLDSFFKVCFILENMGKLPRNANLWLIYLLTYIRENIPLGEIAQLVYCLDFLYSKLQLKNNELNTVVEKVKELLGKIRSYANREGSYTSSASFSPLEETRYALFALNLLEDLVQDAIFYYDVGGLKPIKKIYENVVDIEATYDFLKRSREE